MKWPKFEQLINKRLSKRRAEVDVDTLWAALEPEVDAINRKKQRKAAWWWFPIGSGLLVAGLAAWFWWGIATPPTVEALPILLEGAEHAGMAVEGAETRSGFAVGGKQAEAQEAQSSTAVSGKHTEARGAQSSTAVSGKHAEARGAQSSTAVGGRHAEAQGARSDGKKGNRTLTAAQSDQQNEMEEHVETEESAGFLTREIVLAMPPEILLPAVLTSSDKAIATIPTLSTSVDSRTEEESCFPEDSTAAATPLIKPRQKFRFSVAVQGGAGLTQIKGSARSSTDESLALLELRNRRERLLEHSQAGLHFNLHHTSGVQLSTGLHYTQINERYDYQRSERLTIDSVYGPQWLVVNLYDEIDTIYGSVPVEEVTTHTKRYYNRHQMLDLPILLGYQRPVAPRLKLGVQAGGFLNIRMRSKGRIASLPDNDIEVNEAQAYRSRVGWSYYLGLLVEYQLSPRIHAYAAPSMRYFPESFTRPDYPLERAYRLYTVNIGVRYGW